MSWDLSIYPDIVLEIDTNGPTLGSPLLSPNWADITSYFRQIVIRPCARASIFDRFSAGKLDVLLDNRGREFDPNYAGTYSELITPGTKMRVRAVWDNDIYFLIQVYLDGGVQEWPGLGHDHTIRIGGTDLFKVLNLADLGSAGVDLAAAKTGARVLDVLDAVGLDNSMGSADDGLTDVVAKAAADLAGAKALGHLQDVADTENGQLFVNGAGTLVFQDRHHRILQEATPTAVFGDGPGRNILETYGVGPSFEDDIADWTGTQGGETLTQVSNAGQAIQQGTQMLQVDTPGGVADSGVATAGTVTIRCAEGAEMTLSMHLNVPVGATVRMWVDFYDENPSYLSSELNSVAGAGAMERHDYSFTVPTDARYIRVYANVQGTTATTFYVDGVQLEYGALTDYADDLEIGYGEGIQMPVDEERLWNQARVTASDVSSTVFTYEDTDSRDAHGPRTFERTVLTDSLVDAESTAQYIVSRYATPFSRFDQLVLSPARDPHNLWPVALGLGVSDRVTVRKRPPLGGVIELDNYMEGAPAHDITPDNWTVTLTLSDADRESYWVLGDEALGLLGDTTRLGY